MLLVSDECFVLDLNTYCIILRYSVPWDNWLGFIFRYAHVNLCTTEYWPILWTRFNFLMWVTISLRQYRLFIYCFRQKSVHLSLLRIFLPLIQLLLRQNGLVKTSNDPKFDYSWELHNHTFKGLENRDHIEGSPYLHDIVAYGWTLSSHENKLLRLLLSELWGRKYAQSAW